MKLANQHAKTSTYFFSTKNNQMKKEIKTYKEKKKSKFLKKEIYRERKRDRERETYLLVNTSQGFFFPFRRERDRGERRERTEGERKEERDDRNPFKKERKERPFYQFI